MWCEGEQRNGDSSWRVTRGQQKVFKVGATKTFL